MHCNFYNSFAKDLERITQSSLLEKVENIIGLIEAADSLYDIVGIKRMKTNRSCFRVKVGDYRIGLYLENNIVHFSRFLHRSKIYSVFP